MAGNSALQMGSHPTNIPNFELSSAKTWDMLGTREFLMETKRKVGLGTPWLSYTEAEQLADQGASKPS